MTITRRNGLRLFACSVAALSLSALSRLSRNVPSSWLCRCRRARGQQLLVINPQLPVKTLHELAAYSKQNPDKLSYSSAGNGTPGHLATELLKSLTGIHAARIPCKGGAPALNAVLAGEVRLTVDVVPTLLPFVRTDKLRALAMLSTRRSERMPEVRTVGETGLPEVAADFWSGLVAPARTPRVIVDRLNFEVRKITEASDFKAQLAVGGAQAQATSVTNSAGTSTRRCASGQPLRNRPTARQIEHRRAAPARQKLNERCPGAGPR